MVSFKSPRVLVWSIGCIIWFSYGYCIPWLRFTYGQMSLWGYFNCPKCILFKFTVTKIYEKILNDLTLLLIIQNNSLFIFQFVVNFKL